MASRLISLALYFAAVALGFLAMWVASKYSVRQRTLWVVFIVTTVVLIAALSLAGIRLFPGAEGSG
ncbi:hypothetical protein NU688_18085 [Variovorax sp. ZS18.2.2]|uniref:hypothetical protein n=1 Tax=Variovorax sp. ZS18.2.2 TaxID=2971255 RepID=UPI002150A4A4|nr:hypothetical protein [Variovorax sp. ZS18.2.2]MCR6478076.1 hypothetical protein [Variovorax sp. ZS18.2.2]